MGVPRLKIHLTGTSRVNHPLKNAPRAKNPLGAPRATSPLTNALWAPALPVR